MTMRTLMSAASLAALAALVPATAFAKADFSGFWSLQGDPFAVPKAQVTDAAAKTVAALKASSGINALPGSPAYSRTWCIAEGLPWTTTSKNPVDIRQGPLTVSITTSGVREEPRHIYIDGQKYPGDDIFDFTTIGHSAGKWQGNTLTVTTQGFHADHGIILIPGDGLRSEKSKLAERYELVNPDLLRVTYTWTDPTTLKKPHTYTYNYARIKEQVWITEPQCSPIKAMREKGITLPTDAPED